MKKSTGSRLGSGLALVLGFVAGLSLAFTNATAPARAPTLTAGSLSVPSIYIYDPYQPGGVGVGIPNVTGKVIACAANQAIGFADDGGSINAVCVDTSSSTAVNVAPAAPTTPSTSTTYDFSYDAGGGGWPAIQYMVNDFWTQPIPVGVLGQAFSMSGATQQWNWKCTRVTATNAQVTGTNGLVGVNQSMATSSPAWDGTSVINRVFWVTGTTAASINTTLGYREGTANETRGSVAGTGGFMFGTRVAIHKVSATIRVAIGLFSSLGSLTATVNPSTFLDTVYFGCDDGDTNLSICSNDNSGAATCTTLGSDYPCQTVDAQYDMRLAAAPAGSTISWYIERIDVPHVASGFISTDLPRNTVQLAWQDWINTGSGTTTITFYFNYACTVSNF